jgi:hypothetical protein
MTYLSLARWSGQFSNPKVIAQIRRAIRGRVAGGECLVVQDDSARGLTDEIRRSIQEGFSPSKVRFSRIHPDLGGPTERKPTPPRKLL